MTPIPVPCEAARYAAAAVYVPDLWVDTAVWRGWAGYLGHRGWEGWLAPVRSVAGGLAARAEALAAFARSRPTPPVLVGHGAGAVVAALAAMRSPVQALVLLAPLVPARSSVGGLLFRTDAALALLAGWPIPPPGGEALTSLVGRLPSGLREEVTSGLGPESTSAVLDLARGRVAVPPTGGVPALVVAGAADPLTPPDVARRFAAAIDADVAVVPGADHGLVAGAAWQRAVGLVHRWLVRRLSEDQLEFYAEAMADRDED